MLEVDDPRDGGAVGVICEGTVLELIPELVELDVPAVIVVLGAAWDGLDVVETDPLVFEVVGMDTDADMPVVMLVLGLLPDGLVFEKVVDEVLIEVCPEILVRLKLPLCDVTTLFCELPPVVLPPELTAVVIELDIPLWEIEAEAAGNDELLEFDTVVCEDELVLYSDVRPLGPVPRNMEAAVVVCVVVLAEICVEPIVEFETRVKVGFEEKRLGDKFPPGVVCDCIENNDPEVIPDVMPVVPKIPVCEATVEVVCDVASLEFVLEELKDVVLLCDAELEYVCGDPVVGLAIEEVDPAVLV